MWWCQLSDDHEGAHVVLRFGVTRDEAIQLALMGYTASTYVAKTWNDET